MTGLILLVFLGIIVAFGYTRMRGKMKLGVSGKHWTTTIAVVVILGLMIWAAHNGSH